MKGLIALGLLLVVAWIFGFVVFKVAGFLIHLLVIVGAVVLIYGFIQRTMRGSRSPR